MGIYDFTSVCVETKQSFSAGERADFQAVGAVQPLAENQVRGSSW